MRENKRSAIISLSVFSLDNLAICVILPIFTLLLLNPSFGVLPPNLAVNKKFFLLGILIASFPVGMLFGALGVGAVADSFGRKKAFICTLTGELFATLFTGYALMQRNYNMILIGRVIAGLFAGNITICLATIADISRSNKVRSSYFGLLGALSGVTFIGGVLLGGVLSDRLYNAIFSPSFVFWIVTGATAINLLLIIFFFNEPPRDFKTMSSPFGMRAVYLQYAIYFLAVVGWFMLVQFLNSDLYIRFQGTKQLMTWMLTGTGIIFSLGTGILGRKLCVLCPIHPLIATGLFITMVFLTLAGWTSQFDAFIVYYFIAVLGISIVWISLLSLISAETPDVRQGKVMSANQAILALSMAIAPVLGGLIGDQFSLRGIYYFSSGFTGLAFLLYLFFVKRR